MLESISWQEFFTTVAVLLGGYYAITTLLLYGSEIINIFKQRNSNLSVRDARQDQSDSNESNDLMGSVRYENNRQQSVPREEVTDAYDLNVLRSNEDEEPVSIVDVAEESLKNDFATIQAEINSLAEIGFQSTKEESISLFKTLLSNYPQFIGTSYKQQISEIIHDSCKKTCQFHFEFNEINSWWTESENISNNA